MEAKEFYSLDYLDSIDCFSVEKIDDDYCWVETLVDGTRKIFAKSKSVPNLFYILSNNFNEELLDSFGEDFTRLNKHAYININNIENFSYVKDEENHKIINVLAEFKSQNIVRLYGVKKSQFKEEKEKNDYILKHVNCCADVRNFYY